MTSVQSCTDHHYRGPDGEKDSVLIGLKLLGDDPLCLLTLNIEVNRMTSCKWLRKKFLG